LNFRFGNFDARRATIDDHADTAAMGFAKSGDTKELTEDIPHCSAILIQSLREREVDRLLRRRIGPALAQ